MQKYSTDSYGKTTASDKQNPTLTEMIDAMQEYPYAKGYMDWANKYADEQISYRNVSEEQRQAEAKKKAAGTNSWRTNSTKR